MAKLNFKKFGEGEPLIIMHGLYGSSDNWVSIARELMTSFSVYLLDLRNHGASPHLSEHNYRAMADDLSEFMNDHNIVSSVIVGHSMGGKVAMFFTSRQPERVKKLIVVDISPRSYDLDKGDSQVTNHKQILDALSALDLQQIVSRREVDEMLSMDIPSQRVRQFLLKNLKRNKYKNFQWKINVDALNINLPSILIGLGDEQDNLLQYPNSVLFIRGGDSDYITDADEVLINNYFKRPKLTTIKNASHWVHAEKPIKFIEVIKEFVLS